MFIFSQGIEPIEGRPHELALQIILKLVDYVSVRDEKSLKYLKKLHIKADLTSDPVYSLVENFKVSDSKKGLVVQLRDYKGFSFTLLDDLAVCLKGYRGKIKVLSLQNEVDETVCRLFYERLSLMKKDVEYVPFRDIESVFETLNNAEYVISTRLHGLIVANALKSKTFALAYDSKIKALTDEFRIPYIDLRRYNRNELPKKLLEFFKNKQEILPYRKFDWSLTDVRFLKRI